MNPADLNNDNLRVSLLVTHSGGDTHTVKSTVDLRDNPVSSRSSQRPTVYLEPVTVNEATNSVKMVAKLSSASDRPVTVTLTTSPQSATADVDYYGARKRITIPAGKTSGSVIVNILDDNLDEQNETINTHLSGVIGAIRGTARSTITIIDDDAPAQSPNTPAPSPAPPIQSQPTPSSPPNGITEVDSNLPFGGLFYGNPFAGKRSANSAQFWHEASRRFRADRTGRIVAVRHHNRVLTNTDINGRCKPSSPNSAWCQCKSGGLDELSCGYHLSNSYSLGNGGSILIEIRQDDGTANHNPSNVVLGRASSPFIPHNYRNLDAIVIKLQSAVSLQAGQIYHLVYKQLNPPKTCTSVKKSISEARRCERNAGVIGLNGFNFTDNKWRGPVLGTASAILWRNSANESFRHNKSLLSWYEIQYDDGVWTGETYGYYRADSVGTLGGMRTFGGSTQLRERFTVRDATRLANGLWVNVGRNSSSGAGALQIAVKDNRGANLATASVPASNIGQCSGYCATWVHVPFSSAVNLVVGNTYSVVLSAKSGAKYVASTGFPINKFSSRNRWDGAEAEYSSNGGSSWKPFTVNGSRYPYYRERDLSMVFTLAGMPKQLP